jgi:hypothetical protein
MFQRFFDAADYWFGYSDTSSAGSVGDSHKGPLNNQGKPA